MFFHTRHISLILLGFIIVLVGLYFLFYYISMRNVKEPPYQVISRDKSIETRHYSSMFIAEVNESGERDTAIRQGFRQLADYIFGNNTSINSDKGTNVKMTAPVLQTPSKENTWQIRFVMPQHYTLETLPKPNNLNVKIYEQPAMDVVLISFSGSITEENINKHLALLQKYAHIHQINMVNSYNKCITSNNK